MTFPYFVLIAALLLPLQATRANQVEEVPKDTPDIPALPEDLFRLPPDTWAFARELWKGNDPCTADECEAGYTTGDLVVSVERSKGYVRIVAGFRGCGSVSWNEYEIGDKASSGDTKAMAKRIKKTVGTSAKYCKVQAPTIATLDTRQLFRIAPQPAAKENASTADPSDPAKGL